MKNNKIIRTICYFTMSPTTKTCETLMQIEKKLLTAGYAVQTKRICSPSFVNKMDIPVQDLMLSTGSFKHDELMPNLNELLQNDLFFNLDLTEEDITNKHTEILYKIINEKPESTFKFTYTFNPRPSTPFFPSANYEKEGFSIGLQSTDLSENCNTIEEWFNNMRECWNEIDKLYKNDPVFLGIDSSIAPLYKGKSSLINFIHRLGYTFPISVTNGMYIKMTRFIKEQNPHPVGLNGLMLPCLEDFELTKEYMNHEFPIERNIYLSLHSGLGIDTYPIGINEDTQRITEILKLIQAFSNKYDKSLSVRFVSDGKAKIGGMTEFDNKFLTNTIVQKI